jgi:hypothetical protein
MQSIPFGFWYPLNTALVHFPTLGAGFGVCCYSVPVGTL